MGQEHHTTNRTEAALYWSAMSLIVCEGLSLGKAAERLGIDRERLRRIMRRRRTLRPFDPTSAELPNGSMQ